MSEALRKIEAQIALIPHNNLLLEVERLISIYQNEMQNTSIYDNLENHRQECQAVLQYLLKLQECLLED